MNLGSNSQIWTNLALSIDLSVLALIRRTELGRANIILSGLVI